AEVVDLEAGAINERGRRTHVREQPDARRQAEAVVEDAEEYHERRRRQQRDAVVAELLAAEAGDYEAGVHRDAADDRNLAVVGLATARLVDEANCDGKR